MNTLYNQSRNPKKSTKGTGFKDEEKALETIKIIKKLDTVKQMQIVLTMYYRAEHHPHKTPDMKKAQKVFKSWLISKGYRNSVKKRL